MAWPFDVSALGALVQVILINAALSGDNFIVIGLAAMSLPPAQRARAVWIGVALSTSMLASFAIVATALLQVLGLLVAGGLLLLWVAWKLWRDLTHTAALHAEQAQNKPKTLWQALWQIAAADISMSLDNVLAITGAAHDHPTIMVIGLGCSVVLMATAATLMARLLARYRWLAYAGLAMILLVAIRMIWTGTQELIVAAAN